MELQIIQSKIYEIRGYKVMLDSDLSEMYGVEKKRLNEQVKRNINRFPEDFMFQLTKIELENLKSQFATSSWGGMRKLPYAFTELGVAMLSTVLSSQTAIQINISIMRAFIAIRQMLTQPKPDRYDELKQYVEEMFSGQNDINEDTRMHLEIISQTLAEMQNGKQTEKPRRPIGYAIYPTIEEG